MEKIQVEETDKSLAQKAKYNRVLLLDDNTLDNFVNKKAIEINNFAENIESFESAFDVLKFLKEKSSAELPDIIFLDIIMPGMDGFRFLEEFAGLNEHIVKKCRIIMLSNSESFKDLNRANKHKLVCKFLNKPLNREVLAAISV